MKCGIHDYLKCRNCKYTCVCCQSHATWLRCSGCEQNSDEFAPAEHIKFCPLDGSQLKRKEEHNENQNVPTTT